MFARRNGDDSRGLFSEQRADFETEARTESMNPVEAIGVADDRLKKEPGAPEARTVQYLDRLAIGVLIAAA